MSEPPAPCVAVVGPANSGKTTLLHLLDAALQAHPSSPLVYAVKGNPDGTGRYLFHAPELREALKQRVKGSWCETTVETVGDWIHSCREHLDLVLVDLGGRRAAGNDRILAGCTHFILLARRLRDEDREAAEGMVAWEEDCRRNGLQPVALLESLWRRGRAGVRVDAEGALHGTFRADAVGPGDPTNREVIGQLTEALLRLVPRWSPPPYLDLRLPRAWRPADLVDLGGLRSRVLQIVGAGRPLVLGGAAPMWAYCAAMHRALDVDTRARVRVFDPKLPAGLVEIPPSLDTPPHAALERSLQVQWRPRPWGPGTYLDVEIRTPDRFLRLAEPSALAGLPRPAGEPPPGPLVGYGAGPIWLHLAYSRWLRALPGRHPIGLWDARFGRAAIFTGAGAPAFERLTENRVGLDRSSSMVDNRDKSE